MQMAKLQEKLCAQKRYGRKSGKICCSTFDKNKTDRSSCHVVLANRIAPADSYAILNIKIVIWLVRGL